MTDNLEKLENRIKDLEGLVARLIRKLGLEKDLLENYEISKDKGKVLEVLGFSGFTIEHEREKIGSLIAEHEMLEALQSLGRKTWKLFGPAVKRLELTLSGNNLRLSVFISSKDLEKEKRIEAYWISAAKERASILSLDFKEINTYLV